MQPMKTISKIQNVYLGNKLDYSVTLCDKIKGVFFAYR